MEPLGGLGEDFPDMGNPQKENTRKGSPAFGSPKAGLLFEEDHQDGSFAAETSSAVKGLSRHNRSAFIPCVPIDIAGFAGSHRLRLYEAD